MDNTENLNLPYIISAQAQKHVTHNEALRMLDALVNLSAIEIAISPPATPEAGSRYIVGTGATGAWQGKDKSIAAWQDGAWGFFTPQTGWRCYVSTQAEILVWRSNDWQVLESPLPALQNLPHAGINTTADDTNRLSVSSPATLLSHEGDNHHLVVNKATNIDTASLLFQTNWTGHAQFGISGDNNLRINTSIDGNIWNDAIVADAATGMVSFPSGIENPQLYGVPENLTDFDRLYLDAINGDDANDGRTKTTALKTITGLAELFVIGRKLEIRLLSDITFDRLIQIGYAVPQLVIYGRKADDSGWENRKITVVDATNFSNHPGSFMFQSFASLYVYRIDVELATTKAQALFNFYNTMGFMRTHTMTLTRTGTGSCSLFSNGSSFVPNTHTALNVDTSADGYVAKGVAAGANPNNDWRYPSNLSSF